MAKKNVSAFDEILEKFSSDEDRTAFQGLAERNSFIKDYGLRQSDFSRRQDELREDISELEKWRDWKSRQWDDDRQMTKTELAKLSELEALQTEKAELEARIALGNTGEKDMTFADLTSDLQAWMKEKKIVTQDVVDQRTSEFEARQAIYGHAATTLPYLTMKYEKEFGDVLDPDDFLKAAADKNANNLRDFYEKDYIAERRMTKKDDEYKAALAKKDLDIEEARKAGVEASERRIAMGANGQNPMDLEGPQMGAFQKKFLGLDNKEKVGSGAPEVELGEGGISAYAAREFINNRASRS